jgi:hypothetical protein
MKIERTSTGKIELRLSDDPDQFKRLAEVVRKKLEGRWTEQLDEFDQSYWDLDVGGKKITVHREHFLGVSVFCDDDAPLRSLLEDIQREFETVPRK